MRWMLQACLVHKVKKLIVTSSAAAVNGTSWKGNADPYYNEGDFAAGKPGSSTDGYIKSKILQEQECIKFLQERAGCAEPEIVTLHPCFVIGPIITPSSTSSIEGMRKMLSGQVPFVPEYHQPFVDVRDVAQAHINALLAEPGKLQGHRISVV